MSCRYILRLSCFVKFVISFTFHSYVYFLLCIVAREQTHRTRWNRGSNIFRTSTMPMSMCDFTLRFHSFVCFLLDIDNSCKKYRTQSHCGLRAFLAPSSRQLGTMRKQAIEQASQHKHVSHLWFVFIPMVLLLFHYVHSFCSLSLCTAHQHRT